MLQARVKQSFACITRCVVNPHCTYYLPRFANFYTSATQLATSHSPVKYTTLRNITPSNFYLHFNANVYFKTSNTSLRFKSDDVTGDGNGTTGDTLACHYCKQPLLLYPISHSNFARCENCNRLYRLTSDEKMLGELVKEEIQQDDLDQIGDDIDATSSLHEDDEAFQEEELDKSSSPFNNRVPTPKEIYKHLDLYVVGQDHAKKVLAVAVYNHYKRLSLNTKSSNATDNTEQDEQKLWHQTNGMKGIPLTSVLVPLTPPKDYQELIKRLNEGTLSGNSRQDTSSEERKDKHTPATLLDKSNILMLGPTGSGKTLLVQTLAKYLDVPLAICDCTVLTQAGYVGEDIESVVVKLVHESRGSVERAESGIVFLDEVDKIACVSGGQRYLKDVSGEGVQQGLLKLLEGSNVNIPDKSRRRGGESSSMVINTSNILFIAAGAFSGINKIIAVRKEKKIIGFGAPVNNRSLEEKQPTNNVCNTSNILPKKFRLFS
eukprot:TRINITY_DN4769_c0_g1_i2.p1 TRINITY_DN4769_c0_g1~~TRINITY_DN4769_c0_g1_i2.p1  ORF type:complete len:490 (-),score=126.78 TRINITY_DN4769_c0_g1_i2:692-2161(-)